MLQQILDVIMQILRGLYHFCQTPVGSSLLTTAAPVIVGWIAIKLHLNANRQSEVGHAVNYVVKGLTTGKFDTQGAINTILATGKVPESKATTIVTALVNKEAATVAPTKGVLVTVNPDGNVSVDPSGFIAKKSYKISKWLKKRIKKL